MTKKPRLFIGSSAERKTTAEQLQLLLASDFSVKLWDNPTLFPPGRGILESLLNTLDTFDFAVLILGPDDVVESRGETQRSPRDNVLLELGLFMGRLGRERTFVLLDPERVKIPTDLGGIVFVAYDSAPDDHDMHEALRPAATLMRNVLHRSRSSQAPNFSLPQPTSAGIAAYYPRYPIHEMTQHLSTARDEIYILQTWISNWNELCEAFKVATTRARNKGSELRIRIILIDPSSPFCEARGMHSGESPGDATNYAEISLRNIRKFKREEGLTDRELAIRLSTELPTFAMFGADGRIYFNPYLRLRNTYRSSSFVFQVSEGSYASQLLQHFDGLWDNLGGGTDG